MIANNTITNAIITYTIIHNIIIFCVCIQSLGLIYKLSLADVVTSTSVDLPPYKGNKYIYMYVYVYVHVLLV